MPRDTSSPFMIEPDGTYITIAQMKFFLNSTKGEEAWHERKESFVKYHNMCRVYNLVSEVLEVDPTAATLYWDSSKESISMAFPVNGCIAKAIRGMRILKETDYGFDFGGNHWTL